MIQESTFDAKLMKSSQDFAKNADELVNLLESVVERYRGHAHHIWFPDVADDTSFAEGFMYLNV